MSSPFVFRILADKIYPVAGIDGLIHLSYVAQVTNTTVSTGENFKAVPVDPRRNFDETGHNAVETDEGQDITGLIKRFSEAPRPGGDQKLQPDDEPLESERQQYLDALSPGGSGLMFFDVTYTDPQDIPSRLSHGLVVDLPENGLATHTAFTISVPVSCEKPVVLRPPLAGSGWFDGNGCCAIVNAHRSAVLHLNGDLWPAQQFAIDWVRLNSHGSCCSGDPSDLKSWKFYGVPIYAAASGTVVGIPARDQPDQKPLKPEGVTLQNLLGNSIIEDIGNGRFILYAHLAPGSIPANIQEGTRLTVGQVIGKLGNSGNSSAPHLHFQVMDGASALVAHGLPFVFDHLEVEGRIIGDEGPVVDEYLAGKSIRLDTSGNGPQREKMPLSSRVYGFE